MAALQTNDRAFRPGLDHDRTRREYPAAGAVAGRAEYGAALCCIRAGESSMTRLAQLEQDFQAFVLEGTTGIEQQVVGTVCVPIATRLKVYSDAYRARLKE